MNRDPYGLGQLLYAYRPAPPAALLAAGMTLDLQHGHDDCGIGAFCRNPLHPGPCKGWKKNLGKLAPGALTAIEKARKARVEERRVKTAQAKATAAGGLSAKELQSPLHAKKSIHKRANQLLGNTPGKAQGKADRVILNKTEIKRYSQIKAAQVDALAAKHGLQPIGLQGTLATAFENDNHSGRDIAYRATLEAAARLMAENLAKKICKKGDGDCDGIAYEDLKRALEEGFRPAVATGDDSELEGLIKARAGGQLLKPTGKNPYTPTQPRPARPGPVQGPAKPNAAQQAQAKKAAKAAQAPAAAPAAPNPSPSIPAPAKAAPSAPSAPARTPMPSAGGPPLPPMGQTTPGLPGTTPPRAALANRSDRLLVGIVRLGSPGSRQVQEAEDELKRRGLDKDGNPLPNTPNAPAAPAAPAVKATPAKAAPAAPAGGVSPAAPLPATATADAKHAHAVANRTAPRSGVAKTQVDAYDKLTKAEFDSLPPATQQTILADLKAAEGKFLDPKKVKRVQDLQTYLRGSANAAGVPSAPNAPAAPAAPAASAAVPKWISDFKDMLAKGGWQDDDFLDGLNNIQGDEFHGPHFTDQERKDVMSELDFLAGSGDPTQRRRAANIRSRLARSAPSAPRQANGGNAPAAPNAPAANAPSAPNAPSSPAAGGPSAKAITAAELGAQIHEAATGKRMNDQARKAFAKALHDEQAKGDGVWAKAYADKAGADLAQKTKTYLNGHSLTTGQLADLKTEIADVIDGKRDDMPRVEAIREAWRNAGPDAGAKLSKKLDAISAPAAPANAPDALQARFDAAHKLDHEQLYHEMGQLWGSTKDPAEQKRINAFYQSVQDDTSRPAWLRWSALQLNGDKDAKIQKALQDNRLDSNIALGEAAQPLPAYPTSYMLADSFGIDDAKLADPNLALARQALYERRSHIVKELRKRSANDQRVRSELAGAVFKLGLTGNNRQPELDRYESLDDAAKKDAVAFLREHIDHERMTGLGIQASEHQTVLDQLDGTNFSRPQERAIRTLHDRLATWTAKIHEVENLDQQEWDSLPPAHRYAMTQMLENVGGNSALNPMDRMAALDVLAKHDGDQPNYGDAKINSVVKQATYWNGIINPPLRGLVYADLSQAQFDQLQPRHESAVLNDMVDVAQDPSVGTEIAVAVQSRFDAFSRISYHPDQQAAILQVSHLASHITSPTNRTPQPPADERLNAYKNLDKGMYDALPKAYQRAIRDDLEALVATHPNEAGTSLHKFDPSWNPPAAPAPVRTVSAAPHVQAALDVIYGNDPKHKQITQQMAVYTALPKNDFDGLQLHEQQTLLADLSYIATTSKSATTKAKAERLLDRFTPPGTTLGTLPPSPAIVAPPSAVANQTRFPDPGGRVGVLTQSTNPGQRGDEWMNVRGSTTRVWGKYGAAGLLLRHIDPQTGEQRFLIAQRGPAISNPGLWQLPGGAIESKEKPIEGATRETLEELGFKQSDFATARVHGYHEAHVGNVIGTPTGDWKYTSFAADVDSKLPPDLSAPGARAETSDAKWMTLAEIDALDKQGKILGPLAGGKLQQNIVSLFPSAGATQLGRPGPITQRPKRAVPPAPPTPYKQSTAKNLIPDAAGRDAVSDLVKGSTGRKRFEGKVADARLAVIHEAQGFDRTPTVKSKQEIDALLATGDYIEVWRGVKDGSGITAKDIAEDFRTGGNYNGFGVFGNGYYFASDKAIADNYARGGWRGGSSTNGAVIRALIPKSATLVNHRKIEDEQRQHFDSALHRIRNSDKGGRTLHDEGRYASAKGIDAIEVSRRDYAGKGGYGHLATKPVYVVQNRSMLIVQEA